MELTLNLSFDTDALKRCERTIQSGMATFVAVGIALAEIREKRLYLQSHTNFADYCQQRWNMAVRTAYQTIESGKIVRALGDIGQNINESTARELARVPEHQRKSQLLAAIAEMPDLTAKQLRFWLLKRSHIKQHIEPPSSTLECPICGGQIPRDHITAASRGNRGPSKAPELFRQFIGRKTTSAIDYGCGRMRNALTIEAIADQVTYCDLPSQVSRVTPLADGRRVLPVPLTQTAETVFLIHVAHIQPSEQHRADVIRAAAASSERWLVIETPQSQTYYEQRKTQTHYKFLSQQDIAQNIPQMRLALTRLTTTHNRAYIFEHQAS